jgi:hypothetical protein
MKLQVEYAKLQRLDLCDSLGSASSTVLHLFEFHSSQSFVIKLCRNLFENNIYMFDSGSLIF